MNVKRKRKQLLKLQKQNIVIESNARVLLSWRR